MPTLNYRLYRATVNDSPGFILMKRDRLSLWKYTIAPKQPHPAILLIIGSTSLAKKSQGLTRDSAIAIFKRLVLTAMLSSF